jgi:hypothetical protein
MSGVILKNVLNQDISLNFVEITWLSPYYVS